LRKKLVATLSKYMGVVQVVESKESTSLGIDLDEELGRKPKLEEKEDEDRDEDRDD
jgi:hypothetical protein